MPMSRKQIISCHSVVACFPTDEMVIKYGAEPHLRHVLWQITSGECHFHPVQLIGCPIAVINRIANCPSGRGIRHVKELIRLRQVPLGQKNLFVCENQSRASPRHSWRRHEAHFEKSFLSEWFAVLSRFD